MKPNQTKPNQNQQELPYQVRMDLGVMAMKEYYTYHSEVSLVWLPAVSEMTIDDYWDQFGIRCCWDIIATIHVLFDQISVYWGQKPSGIGTKIIQSSTTNQDRFWYIYLLQIFVFLRFWWDFSLIFKEILHCSKNPFPINIFYQVLIRLFKEKNIK